MSFTASRWLVRIRRLAAAAALAALFSCGASSTENPHFGGVLRIELRETSLSLDPREWKPGAPESAANEKLATLIFDRLVSLDAYGRFQPQLAIEWTHDAGFKRWAFTLRGGVKFSDGAPLTAAEAEAALQPLLPAGAHVSGTGMNLTVQSNVAMPDLLEQLASSRYFVYRDPGDGRLLGTGAFILTEFPPAKADGKSGRYILQANRDCWAGRPFLDRIEITAGLPALTRMLDLQLGRAEIVELAPELVRRAQQEDLRVWASDPVTLYALRFAEGEDAASSRMREAVVLSLDRAAMAGVLLQRQAMPAAALLPEWLSGYASLFSTEPESEPAGKLRDVMASAALPSRPVLLRVDATGELAKLLGERVVLNARQGGINLQVAAKTAQRSASSDATAAHLFVWRFASLSPREEFDALSAELHLSDSAERSTPPADPQQLYARERKLLDDRRVVPLVLLPEYVGLAPNVRDWMPSRWDDWHLADAWLDTPEPRPLGLGRNISAAGAKP